MKSNLLQKFSLGIMALPVLPLAAQQVKPNVILIMTDQQSYNTISAHADMCKDSYFSTPNIDRLVKNGISFTQVYCTNPVSVPSRFSLFTGMYGGQYGIRDNQCAAAQEAEVRPMLATNGMGAVFARGGYDTYYGGKVHLPFSGKQGKGHFAAPVGYGFENYYSKDERDALGVEAARILDGKGKEMKNGRLEKPFLMVASFLNPHDICLEGSTGLSPVVEDKGGRKQVITECVREMRARAAAIDSVEFYKKHAPGLPFNFDKTSGFPDMKKAPYKEFPEYYWRKYRWTYGQLVSLVDSHIGHIVDALDRNPELKKNTIVVFTSDHGEMQGAHQLVTKGVPYDECQRVPLIVCGPGVKAGGRNHSLVCNGTDLLPTICELAGIEAPRTDGFSLASHIKGTDKTPVRETLYLEGQGFLSVIGGGLKYSWFDGKGGGEMLIDLKADKGELKNILSGNESRAAGLRKHIPTDKLKSNVKKAKKEGGKNQGKKGKGAKRKQGKNKQAQ